MRRIDLTGKAFTNLVVIAESKRDQHGVHWNCKCICGNIASVRGSHLRQGRIKSCGCKQGNYIHEIKHGHAIGKNKKASPEYYTWLAMMSRCNNPKNKKYSLYGGRGIKFCERWKLFINFIADLGNRPSKKHSLDRYPNKDGNYEPSNCRWATIKEQNRNTSRNVFIEYDGRNQILEEWATEINADPGNIGKRLKNGQQFGDIYAHYKNVKKRNRKIKV